MLPPPGEFEEQYLKTLFDIENGIMSVFRRNPKLLDTDVNAAVEGLVKHYANEERGLNPPKLFLGEQSRAVFDQVRDACEAWLGRQEPASTHLKKKDASTLSVAEVLACLRRIHTSIRRWTKEGGRQGYLTFIHDQIGRFKP